MSNTSGHVSSEFLDEWRNMKSEYEKLSHNVEAAQNSISSDLIGEISTLLNVQHTNHPSIVKIIRENKEEVEDGMPHLIYVSREKQPNYPHHFKAGAMNVLTRVSALMTNAPFMLNLDCDMFINNPKIIFHAMCLHLGSRKESESAFIQCPQLFYGGIEDDPFGNQMVVWQQNLARGTAGIQGPLYNGTGCFHRRKAIYGLSPNESEASKEILDKEYLKQRYGNSEDFTASAAQLISEINDKSYFPTNISRFLEAASKVSSCSYESDTQWGTEVGWVYGSATEDVLTGQRIHSKGWSTIYCTPEPVPFLGCAPTAGPVINIQFKRWATGLLEILFSKNNPIFPTLAGGLWFRQCLVYISVYMWGLNSIPVIVYTILPAYSILSNTSIMPKVSEPATLEAASLFILSEIYGLSEYLECGLSVRNWWNNCRMGMISALSGRLFGVVAVLLKLLGLSETTFEVTPKDENTPNNHDTGGDPGRFTFDNSSMFVPGTTIVIINMIALIFGLTRLNTLALPDQSGSGPVEIMCSAWVVMNLLPFVKGLYRKGKYGIPSSVIIKSVVLAGLFVQFCVLRSGG